MYSLDLQRMVLWKYFRDQISYFAVAALMGLLRSQKQLCVKKGLSHWWLCLRGLGRKPDWFLIQNPSEKTYLEYKGHFYSQNRFMCAFYIEDKMFQREFSLISHYSVA